MEVKEYEERLRQRVGEAEYGRHKELVRLLARNLALEDVLWEEITVHIRDIDLRTELLRQRNAIVKDIHTEFRALNIEVPTVVEKNTYEITTKREITFNYLIRAKNEEDAMIRTLGFVSKDGSGQREDVKRPMYSSKPFIREWIDKIKKIS